MTALHNIGGEAWLYELSSEIYDIDRTILYFLYLVCV